MARLAQIVGLMVLMLAPVMLLDCALHRAVKRPVEEHIRGREVL